MAADFKCLYVPDDVLVVKCTKASGTVLEAGDMVALDTGLIIKAIAVSSALGFCPDGGANGATVVNVISDKRCIFEGTGEQNFAVTQKGAEVDLVGTTTQLIDNNASSTDVFKIDFSENAGTAGSTAKIRVRINKTL